MIQKTDDSNIEKADNKENLIFNVAFRKDGESFQKIMERILINKLTKNI